MLTVVDRTFVDPYQFLLESSLDSKEIQPVLHKGNQPWIFIGRTDAEAETPILWPPDQEELTHWKRPWCWGRRQKEKGMTEDEMVGWHHWLNGREFQWTPGDSEGQGSLACWGPWSQRVGHDWVTECAHRRHYSKDYSSNNVGELSCFLCTSQNQLQPY